MGKQLVTLAICAALVATARAQVINPPQWDTTDTFLAGGLVRASDGNYYRALHDSVNKNPVADDHTNWELYYVRANTVLKVAATGARFSSLKRAFAMVESATIADPVTVQISIASGPGTYTENFTSAFSLNAVSGAQISISGDNIFQIVLNFLNGSNGLILTAGHTFGGISGVTIQGPGAGGGVSGVLIDSGSTLEAGAFLVQNFDIGLDVEGLSKAVCDNGQAIQCTTGVFANNRSSLQCQHFIVDGKGGGAVGIIAAGDAHVNADKSQVSNVSVVGYQASFATMSAQQSIALGTVKGYSSINFGLLDASDSSSTSQTKFGFEADSGGRLIAHNVKFSQNAKNFNVTVNTLQPNQSFIAN